MFRNTDPALIKAALFLAAIGLPMLAGLAFGHG